MRHILKQFVGREAHPTVQFIKYAIAGGIATGVDIICFYLLARYVLPALNADDPIVRLLGWSVPALDEAVRGQRFIANSAIAFVFSNLTAYIIDILWVFHPGRHNRFVEVSLFFAVSLTSVFIGTALGWVLIRMIGASTTVSYICKMLASLMINYVCRKFLIFKR